MNLWFCTLLTKSWVMANWNFVFRPILITIELSRGRSMHDLYCGLFVEMWSFINDITRNDWKKSCCFPFHPDKMFDIWRSSRRSVSSVVGEVDGFQEVDVYPGMSRTPPEARRRWRPRNASSSSTGGSPRRGSPGASPVSRGQASSAHYRPGGTQQQQQQQQQQQHASNIFDSFRSTLL